MSTSIVNTNGKGMYICSHEWRAKNHVDYWIDFSALYSGAN